jgi:arylesterase/paraoxonase
MMKRALVTLVLVVGVAVAVIGWRIVTRSGVLKDIVPHRQGECRTVEGIVGGEDVTIDRETLTAYVSADDRRAAAAGKPVRGEIFALDLTRRDAAPVPLTGGKPADFHPHGIALWRGPDGARRLFAINHVEGGAHSVAVFDVGANGLTLAETITYPELLSPNDLVAVGPRQFYATNDRRYRDPGVMATLEGYLQLPLASVSYFDGRTGRIVADRLTFTNGINASADGRTVYVAEFLGQRIRIFDRDLASGALTPRDTIPVHTCPDNIELDEAGMLWIGAHPKVFDLLAHGADAGKRAPSQVLRIDPKTKSVDEVLLDDGTLLSGSSAAAVAGDRMLIGTVFEPKILVCDRPRT